MDDGLGTPEYTSAREEGGQFRVATVRGRLTGQCFPGFLVLFFLALRFP